MQKLILSYDINKFGKKFRCRCYVLETLEIIIFYFSNIFLNVIINLEQGIRI